MKKYLLIIVCFCSFSASFAKIDLEAGARVGFNLSHIRKFVVPAGFNKKLMLGTDMGGVLRVNFNNHFGIQTEILFTQKGQRWSQKIDSIKNYNKLVSNYVELPVLGVARIGSDKLKAIFYLGGYFAYWTGGYYQSSTQQDKQTIASSHTDYPFSKGDQRFDAGICTGIGMDIKVGPGSVEIAIRHDLGLMDRSKINDPHTKNFNCNLFISAAYLIQIGK